MAESTRSTYSITVTPDADVMNFILKEETCGKTGFLTSRNKADTDSKASLKKARSKMIKCICAQEGMRVKSRYIKTERPETRNRMVQK